MRPGTTSSSRACSCPWGSRVRSTIPVTARSASPTRDGRQMCSSTPRTSTPSRRAGSASRRVASASTASQQVCQSTPRCRASAETVVSSNGQRIRRPPRRPGGQLRPRRDQVVLFGEHLHRAGRFAAAPQSGQPHQPDRDPEARSVRDDPSTAAVADRDDPARGQPPTSASDSTVSTTRSGWRSTVRTCMPGTSNNRSARGHQSALEAHVE